LSDDLILLGGYEGLQLFSSPFFGQVRPGGGRGGVAERGGYFTAEGIYLLQKDCYDSFSPIDSVSRKAVNLLTNVPFAELCDTKTLNRILDIVERIGRKTSMYRMCFTNSPKFLDILPG
jgi:hypothetical protein